ncbi:MAG: ATP-binding cassette domain-containing protein, partial [Halobacteriales archaeon]
MIRFEGVVHEHDDERALDGLDLTVDAGEFVLLLGRNGSGKTTLLRHTNALLVPDEGRVYV